MRIEVTGQARLAREKAAAMARVNAAIGSARGLFITTIPGQEMIYMGKEAEAKAYLAQDPAPTDLTDYPFIASEVGITAPDAAGVAQVYIAMANLWRPIGSALEAIRLAASSEINATATLVGVAQAEQDALDAIQGVIANASNA